MFRLAICDDDTLHMQNTLRCARETPEAADCDIRTFSAPGELMDAVTGGGYRPHIALLDICMPGLLGTDIAAEMRKQKSRAEIVFLSTSEEFAVEAFAVRAAHYLVKPFTQEAFAQAMDRVMDSLRQRHSGKMVFRLVGGGIQVEEINAILYIESEGHIQKVYTADHSVLEMR